VSQFSTGWSLYLDGNMDTNPQLQVYETAAMAMTVT